MAWTSRSDGTMFVGSETLPSEVVATAGPEPVATKDSETATDGRVRQMIVKAIAANLRKAILSMLWVQVDRRE
jgi:hypothetical protein